MMNLNQKYDREDFLDFLQHTFLQDFAKDIRLVGNQGLNVIAKATSLGRSDLLDLQIFEFEYSGSAGKRIALTKEAFQVMKQSATFNALAVFYGKDSDDWRFSFLTANPQKTEKGKVAIAYSNPRRYSFFLGVNAKINTPTKFLVSRGKIASFEDLKSRFSIEVVNKEFYKEISKAFIKLSNGLLELPFIQEKSRTNLEFAVRLIGRIIFCWFLREKKSESGLALMPKEILSLEAVTNNEDYYHKILEPIFFEVLNKPIKSRKDEFSKDPFSSVPYLNGGLFSPQNDDYYKRNNGDYQSQFHNILKVPDSWIKEFFETLETYNFTIDENTSFDEELSIDPEMLGRIFENLLAEINPETGESARKATGSYYTPRTIVSYMVDESLFLYLKQKTNIDENKLKAIISYDLADDSKYLVSQEEKERIIEALESLKLLDPACGSGAFPIGALQKIVFILQQIDPDGQLWFRKQLQRTSPELRRVIEREFEHQNFDYIRKLGIIRENIYGIDIQPIATEISRLRCFLTLIVDERVQDELENRGIEPLPNLDFKFVTANSLIGLPSSRNINQMGLFEDDQGIRELKELRDMFFTATGVEREQLKLQFVQAQNKMFQRMIEGGVKGYADITTRLSGWDPFSHKASTWFDPEWMFGMKDGFDIVIANPPYIEFKKLGSEAKKTISHYVSAKGKYDIYVVFIEFASKVLKTNGVLTLINPTTFMQKDFGQEIRKHIKNNLKIVCILDFNDFQVFSDVTNYTGVFIFQKIVKTDYGFDYHRYSNSKTKIDYQEFAQSLGKTSSMNFKKYIRVDSSDLENPRWIFRENNLGMLLKKIEEDTLTLRKISESIFQGIASGKDEVFYISKNEIERESLEEEILRPLIKGKDIKAYLLNWSGTYVIYPYKEDSSAIEENQLKMLYPGVYKYFLKNKSKLAGREYFENSTKLWYELWNQRQYSNFKKLRIVVPEISDNNKFALTDKFFGNTKTYHIVLKENSRENYQYVLGILNSKLIDFYYKNISTPHAGGFFAYKTQFLNDIPIKSFSIVSKKIVDLVGKILSLTNTSSYLSETSKQTQVKEYRGQIDQMVYQLYGLNEEETRIVERNNNESTS